MIEYRYIGLFFVLALRASCDMPHPLRITCHHDLDSCEIPLLAFVSCRNASSERAEAIVSGNSEETAMGECDPLVWAAIQEAVENINHNGSGIWRNGRWESIGLKIHLMDIVTQENAFKTVFSFFTSSQVSLTGMVGPGSNAVTQLMAYIFGDKIPAVTVSYGATDTLFINFTGRYSNFFSTVMSERALNMARVGLLTRMKWKRIAIATSTTDHTHTRAAEHLAMLSNMSSIKVTLHHIEGLSLDASLVFREWSDSHTRIIVALLRPLEARRVICQAHLLSPVVLDHTHAWILPHYYQFWWELDNASLAMLPGDQACSNAVMVAILRNMHLLVLDSLNYNIPAVQGQLDQNTYTLGYSVDEVVNAAMTRARRLLSPGLELSKASLRQSRLAAAYDSVWVLALAYHNLLTHRRVRNFTMADLRQEVAGVSFRGMAKDHNFGSPSVQDFSSSALVCQFIDGVLQPVLLINDTSKCASADCFINMTADIALPGFTSYVKDFHWIGGKVPSDGITLVDSSIPVVMLAAALLLNVLAFSICVAMLVAMAVLRNNKHIKSTSPKYMLLAMAACMTAIPAGILYGLSFSAIEYNLDQRLLEFLCTVEYPLFSIGQLVAVAVFVAKSWRIYRIFYNSQQSSEVTGIGPMYLNIMIAVISGVYVLLVLLWLAVDRPQPTHRIIPISLSIELRLSYCEDSLTDFSHWKFALVLYNTMVLLLLCYLSFKNTKIRDIRFKEEGQSTARLAVAIMVSYVILAILVITSLDPRHQWLPRHVQLFWSLTIYASMSPVVFFGVLFIPKYARVYRDFRVKKKEKGDMSHIVDLMLRERDKLKNDLSKKNRHIQFLRTRSSTSFINY